MTGIIYSLDIQEPLLSRANCTTLDKNHSRNTVLRKELCDYSSCLLYTGLLTKMHYRKINFTDLLWPQRANQTLSEHPSARGDSPTPPPLQPAKYHSENHPNKAGYKNTNVTEYWLSSTLKTTYLSEGRWRADQCSSCWHICQGMYSVPRQQVPPTLWVVGREKVRELLGSAFTPWVWSLNCATQTANKTLQLHISNKQQASS